ncbi:MAG: lysozyme [Candidatus Amulumruptor caecigallinarius]|nr:lysozyme [Candidatus Amulumruptor caecigallinarius]
MKNLPAIIVMFVAAACAPVLSRINGIAQNETVTEETTAENRFEKAVEIIKKYETLHKPKHWPLVGYGHKVLPGEKFSRSKALSEAEADKLLRKDLLKNCAVFRKFGADSLLLGVLAYNIGSGAALRSSVARKLAEGNRDIRDSYLAHSRYRGKVHQQIRKRRIEEFDAIFISDITDKKEESKNIVSSIQSVNQFISSNLRPLTKLCLL